MADVVCVFTDDPGNVHTLGDTSQSDKDAKSLDRSWYVDKFVFAASEGLSRALNDTMRAVIGHDILEPVSQHGAVGV